MKVTKSVMSTSKILRRLEMIAEHLVSALQLIEHQHDMLIAYQNGKIRQHLADLNSSKSEIVRLQGEVMRTAKVERIDIECRYCR